MERSGSNAGAAPELGLLSFADSFNKIKNGFPFQQVENFLCKTAQLAKVVCYKSASKV
jgi:hypothetical protein